MVKRQEKFQAGTMPPAIVRAFEEYLAQKQKRPGKRVRIQTMTIEYRVEDDPGPPPMNLNEPHEYEDPQDERD